MVVMVEYGIVKQSLGLHKISLAFIIITHKYFKHKNAIIVTHSRPDFWKRN